MRIEIADKTLGFWFSQTKHGISMGPIIPAGEEHVHLTFFMNGEVFNSHLKIIENGITRYKNLTTMTPYCFTQRLQQDARNMFNSFQPANPSQDAIIMTERGQKFFQELLGGSVIATYKGRKAYVDFDFGVIVDEMQALTEEPMEFITMAKASDIVGSGAIPFGLTEEGAPIFRVNDQIYSWEATCFDESSQNVLETSWGNPIFDMASVIGIPQLFSEIEQRKLFKKCSRRST